MAFMKYSVAKEEKTARAQSHDLDASYKDLTQVCRAIKRLPVKEAFELLDAAIAGKKAIPYFKFNKGLGHRSELHGRKGRYPKKECKMVKAILQNAVANAVHAGLKRESLSVKHASANKQQRFRRYRQFWVGGTTLGYGKQAVWANYETAWLEVVVGESEGAQRKQKLGKTANVVKTPEGVQAEAKSPEKKKQKEPVKSGAVKAAVVKTAARESSGEKVE